MFDYFGQQAVLKVLIFLKQDFDFFNLNYPHGPDATIFSVYELSRETYPDHLPTTVVPVTYR